MGTPDYSPGVSRTQVQAHCQAGFGRLLACKRGFQDLVAGQFGCKTGESFGHEKLSNTSAIVYVTPAVTDVEDVVVCACRLS